MRKEIHPEYVEATVKCGCGATFKTRSTKRDINVEICSSCHPYFTGQQKFVDTMGRVQRFQTKFGGKYFQEAEKAQKSDSRKTRR